MKRHFIVLLLALTLCMTGCGNVTYAADSTQEVAADSTQDDTVETLYGQFIIVDKVADSDPWSDFHTTYVVYDKDTKVMYYILNGYRRCGITPIYRADGTIKMYE